MRVILVASVLVVTFSRFRVLWAYAPIVGANGQVDMPGWVAKGLSAEPAAPVIASVIAPVASAVVAPVVVSQAGPVLAQTTVFAPAPTQIISLPLPSPPTTMAVVTVSVTSTTSDSSVPTSQALPDNVMLTTSSVPPLTITPSFKPGLPVESAPVDLASTAPAVSNCPAVGQGVMTWRITNNFGIPLSLAYLNNFGSPSAIGCPGPATMTPSQTTEVVFPTGWAGRIFVGKEATAGDTLIEGSTTGANDVDISYVDGFSVPITCSNEYEVLTGCNINLWETGSCPDEEGDQGICHNPTVTLADGPATPFFLPCQGAAYTFPNDNIANVGDTHSALVTCCIGTAAQGCAAPARQGHGNNLPSKRSVPVANSQPHQRSHNHLRRHVHRARSAKLS